MRETRAGPCRGLVVQFGIQLERRLDLPVGHHRVGPVALVHFDPVGVEFVLLEGDRLAAAPRAVVSAAADASQRASMLAWIFSWSMPPVMPSASKIGPNSPID